jgi:hypothetical protein
MPISPPGHTRVIITHVARVVKRQIGDRMKKSGMEWSLRGANAILSLRCMSLSNRVEDYWADRATG